MIEQKIKATLDRYIGQPIKLSDLYRETYAGTYTEEEIDKVCYKNVLRVFKENF